MILIFGYAYDLFAVYNSVMNVLKLLFSISRPRFWLYLAGPYIIGYTFGVRFIEHYFDPTFFVWWIYWFVGANIFVYGVNDLSDRDTDAHNEKKGEEEHLLADDEEYVVSMGVMISAFIGLILAMASGSGVVLLLMLIFLFLGYAYSAWPFRFKAKPIIDFSSNFLYVIPGIIGYVQIMEQLPPFEIMLALWAWVGAMHLFSAVPDIVSDKKADLRTSAVVFGRSKSLMLCALLWSFTAFILSSQVLFNPWLYLMWLYPCIVLYSLVMGNEKKVYWLFPWVNGIFGFGFFVVMFLDFVVFK